MDAPNTPETPAPSDLAPAGANAAAGAAADEVDEALAALPRSPMSRNPLVAVAVLVLVGVLIASLRHDIGYALSPGEPQALGDVHKLSFDDAGAGGPLADNRLVELSAQPDYRNALLFEPRGDRYRRAFFRVLGTGSRLWVRAEQTNTRREIGGPVVGRLRRFEALPYAAQVREYYETQVKTTRLLDLDELKRVLASGGAAGSAHDRAGDSLGADTSGPAQVVVDFPRELLVSLSKEKFAVAEDAERELLRLGEPVGPARETKEDFVFPVHVRPLAAAAASPPVVPGKIEAPPAPVAAASPGTSFDALDVAARNAYLAKLEERGFGFQLRREPFVTTLADLRAGAGAGETLSLPSAPGQAPIFDVDGPKLKARAAGDRVEIPWSRVDSVQLSSPIRIPAGAWVIVEGELPSGFTFAPILAAVLLLFGAFNAWLLLRALRRR